ncbi:MAG: hypothetical protein R2750_11415 [Bacteroidales bacterium]
MRYFIWFILLLFLAAGCASKKYTKKAAKFEEAGLYNDAAEYYYEAVKRKDSNVDAKLGLRKNGQLKLDNTLAGFLAYYKQGDYKQTVYEYLNAESYYEKVKSVGVELSFPEQYKTYYEEAKSDYLSKKYIQGIEMLDREDFSAALAIFTEIKNVDENYKDVGEKYIIARYEPKYREAIELIESGQYRKAYYTFDYVIEWAGDYKQAKIYKEQAREKATFAVLVTDISYTNRQFSAGATYITSKIKEGLGKLDNPFLKLIDPQSLDVAIYTPSGKLDMQAANLAGIHAVLSAQLLNYATSEQKLKKTPKKGYLKEVIKIKNDAGVETEKVTYHKTEYMEYQAKNEARLSLNYTMVSTSGSEVLLTGNFNRNKEDEIHYAIFEGEKDRLVPGNWKYKDSKSPEDIVKDEKKDVRELRQLLKAKQRITPAANLLGELVNQAVGTITGSVDNFNPEKE